MSKAMLIDTTRCIGCRACQVACKSWHDLPGAPTTFSETWSNPRFLDTKNYTRVIFREVAAGRPASTGTSSSASACTAWTRPARASARWGRW